MTLLDDAAIYEAQTNGETTKINRIQEEKKRDQLVNENSA
jgi:hypothetical protein